MQRMILWLVAVTALSMFTTVATAQRPEIGIVLGDLPKAPVILSGADIGFRVERLDELGNPMGTFVVRHNGQWIEPRSAAGAPR